MPETAARRTALTGSSARDDSPAVGEPTDPTAALSAATAYWSVLLTPPLSGAQNMAIDHALLHRAARTGVRVLRVYSWREPTLSFGRHEIAGGVYSRTAIRAARLAVVRRPTGGRAVLHDNEITYSVTAPLAPDGTRRARARALYTAINHVLLEGLRGLGVAAELVSPRATGAPTRTLMAGPCFDTASEGELVVRGRKLVGSAQWREAGAVLQHGSMLIADHRSRLSALSPALATVAAPAARTAVLGELLGRVPTPADVATVLSSALDDALARAGAARAAVLSIDTETDAMAVSLRGQYEDDAWTWRR